MSEAFTLARPYARAAFELAQAAKEMESWSAALAVASGVAADPRTHGFLNDPRVSRQQLVGMHLPNGAAADGTFAHFLGELAHFRRLGLLPEIAVMFDALKRDSESTLRVKVTTALELDAPELERLKTSLGKRFGCSIEMDVHVDADLLGGVIIDTGSEVIDGSARGRLDRLASAVAH